MTRRVNRVNRAREYVGLLASLGLVACGAPSPVRLDVALMVESDPGKPLLGAGVSRTGSELGRSDAQGRIALALSGRAGDSVSLRLECPEGYASPEATITILLRPIAKGARIPVYRARCAPLTRSLVVAVRAQNGADLPLKYLGREIARTDELGTAHALLQVAPHETVSLVLDTSDPAHAALRPENPEFTVVMPARDEVALFEKTFTRPLPKRKAARATQPVGPVKLVGHP
jgi:hypothetical protein